MPSDLFPPSKEEALRRLAQFVPNAGRQYALARNHDHGPGPRTQVSMLSPYLRHRFLTEQEVVAAVLQAHSPHSAEKFIQEVFWRTYWKGWLQMRPYVWQSFLKQCTADRERLQSTSALNETLLRAEEGRTGIEGFDDWAKELVQTGYLHNHARMWFASIWIFTLKLPWTLGADFFLRHLLDADPASNTLSWRWVAGLQTPGKHYLARTSNIEKYTGGRYRPVGLVEEAAPLLEQASRQPLPLPPPQPLPVDRPCLLLLHGDDLSGTELLASPIEWRGIWIAAGGHPQHPWPFGNRAQTFLTNLVSDTAARLAADLPHTVRFSNGLEAEALRRFCNAASIRCIVTPEAPVGPLADGLLALSQEVQQDPITFHWHRCLWDTLAWPHATQGFFRFKQHIPNLLERNGLT